MADGCEVMKRRLARSAPSIAMMRPSAWPNGVTSLLRVGAFAAFARRMLPKMLLLRVILFALLSAVIAPPHVALAEPRLLIRDGLIFTMKDGEPTPFLGYVLVGSDGRISTVGRGSPPSNLTAQSTVDASGKMVVPGFVSGHSHIFATGMRGLGASLTIRDWIDAWIPYISASSDMDLYYFTLHGCLDFLKYGITSAYNFAYDGSEFSGYAGKPAAQRPGDWDELQIRGAVESGIRVVHSFSLRHADTDDQNRAYVASVVKIGQRYSATYDNFLKLSIMGSTAFVDTPEMARQEGMVLREFGIDNQSHFLEPPDNLEQRSRFPWFMDAGLLGTNLTFGHFIHTTPEIISASGKAGAMMCWNPMSNGRLASGVADIPACLKAGIHIGMGVDDQAASDIPDPFENMRMGLYMIRSRYEDAKILSPYDVLKFHTLGAAEVMRVADRVGSLEVGKFGDVLVVDPRRRDVGPVHDPYATLVLACGQMNLDQVYVGGVLKAVRGELVGVQFERISDEVHRRVAAAIARVKP
jgi:cytosine/adenosine deaminase-related metal-dependent hydrolase